MIQSMTGFGQVSEVFEGKKITVEIRALNSKNLDLYLKIPAQLKEKELDIRKMCSEHLHRGKVEVGIQLVDENQASQQINVGAFKNYLSQLKQIAMDTNENVNDYFSLVLRMPDVLMSAEESLDDNTWSFLSTCITKALNNVVDFRNQEGTSLAADFNERIKSIEANLSQIPQYEQERIEKVKERILSNIKEINQEVDENRLEQELVLYVEKLDVSEEKVRLGNHLDYFRETMQLNTPVGKKLGFISQEMGREINTLGSKANHTEMQKLVVGMKDDLEKIKEQVLNTL